VDSTMPYDKHTCYGSQRRRCRRHRCHRWLSCLRLTELRIGAVVLRTSVMGTQRALPSVPSDECLCATA
jgi:hypothetical protein